jgi:tetratricopeptide (TPR) repeat protein
MLEEFVESHPKDPLAYEALSGLMMFGGRQADIMEVISAWRENLPNDLRAIQTELAYRGTHMDEAEAAAAAAQLLERDHSAAELYRSCQIISRLDLPQQTDACLERVVRLAGSQNRRVALNAFGELISSLRRQRAWDRIEGLAAAIPPEVDSTETRIGIAYVLVEADRCSTAQELIRELDPKSPPKRINPSYWKTTLASIETKCGDADQGAAEMLDVYRTASLDELAYLGYSADLEVEQAESILLQRIENGDDPAKVYEVLSRIASRDDAPEKRLSYLEAWAVEAPEDPRPQQELAWALKSEGALEPAIDAQREALRRAGDAQTTQQLTEALVSLLIEAEQYEEAATLANELVTTEDSASRGRKLLAEVALAEGKTEEAIALYDDFLTEEPRSCYEVTDYLKLLRDQGRLDKIDAIFSRCSMGDEEDPYADARVRRQLVWLYEELELHERALASLELVLADDPEDNRLWLEKAEFLQKLGRWDEAEACYREVIRLAPRDESAYRGLAEMYRMDERWAEIVALLAPFIAERSSIGPDLGLELARAQNAAGSVEAAATLLERIVKENPKSFDAWYELGEVSVRLDRPDRALAAYRKFLELTTKYDKEEGGSCMCRCDVVDMRDEAKELLPKLESTPSAAETRPASQTG